MHESGPLSAPTLGPDWVDEVLLAGPHDSTCLTIGEDIDRATLRRLVADREAALSAAGLRRGGAVVLNLPPSVAFVTNLLAAWRIGAQACLLDHRLTRYEVDQALTRIEPTVVVTAKSLVGAGLRA